MTLKDLGIGESALVIRVDTEGALRQHILEMGIIPGTQIRLVKYAPMGDPMELSLRGYQLSLRRTEAEHIYINKVEAEDGGKKETETSSRQSDTRHQDIDHPGLGEEGPRYHDIRDTKTTNRPLSFALVGNQNCGKTTLFNCLTGSNQHVGNFPGVTIERKDGTIKGAPNVTITDLPGIYSLSPYTREEVVSRQFIMEHRPSCIINIVDATNIERNLYLTMQLMELDIPMVLALNMMDEVKNSGGTIHINAMEQILGIPVIPISAMKNQGVEELVRHAIHIASYEERPTRQDFCHATEHGGAVHRALHSIMHLIEDHAQRQNIPIRFAANKLMEDDKDILQQLALSQNEQETIEHILCQMEQERNLDRIAAIADMRYSFIEKVCKQCVVRPKENKEQIRSRKIDLILTGKWTAIPAFIGFMALIFYLTFDSLGLWLQDTCQYGIDLITEQTSRLLNAWDISPFVHSLVIDGIFSGVGTILSFLPLIILLFFFLSMLEDSGYMARIAFVMDRLLRKLGLSGRSIVPMLIGFGCSVPSVMACRTLPSARDRKLTILLTPFMSCTAKIPIYAFFATAFFPEKATLAMFGIYLLGITCGILTALILGKMFFKGETVPFVMELPQYRLPVMKNVGRLLWQKAYDFLNRAFTVIFLASVLIWFLQHFDFHLNYIAEGMEQESILARLASLIAPLFRPLGMDDWRIVTALASGFAAKEVVVSTLSTLYPGEMMTQAISSATAICIMIFCLLYTPCVATIATIRKELGGRWALFVITMQCGIAWLVTLIAHLLL